MELVCGSPHGLCVQGRVCRAAAAGGCGDAWPWDLPFERQWSLFPGIPWVPAGEGLHQGTFYLSKGLFASAVTPHGAAKRCKACETITQWIFYESQASNLFAVHSIQEAGLLLWSIKREFKFWINFTYANLFFRSCLKHLPSKLGYVGQKKRIWDTQPKYDLQEMALWNKSFSIIMPPPRDQLLSELGLMDKKKTKVEVKQTNYQRKPSHYTAAVSCSQLYLLPKDMVTKKSFSVFNTQIASILYSFPNRHYVEMLR